MAARSSFAQVLRAECARPQFLSSDELDGQWATRFPKLAECLPPPNPIFSYDEDAILTYGYAVTSGEAIAAFVRNTEQLVSAEVEWRIEHAAGRPVDKGTAMRHRDRYLRDVTRLLENAVLNNYHRGLPEILILEHSALVAGMLKRVPAQAVSLQPSTPRHQGQRIRYAIARVLADLLQRAGAACAQKLWSVIGGEQPPPPSPLLQAMVSDTLLLAEARVSSDLSQLEGFADLELRISFDALMKLHRTAAEGLDRLLTRSPSLARLTRSACPEIAELTPGDAVLRPDLWVTLEQLRAAEETGVGPSQEMLLRRVGTTLKRFELITALRRRVIPVRSDGARLRIDHGAFHDTVIGPSTRPLDFARPGVVSSAVRRCGLVYDLTSFTEILSEVRKKGQRAEEQALRFMYVFQRRLEEIRRSQRLTFEKFLGDGAFYSSRRAERILDAACQIQAVYAELCAAGFPFDRGLRIAMNASSYRILPIFTGAESGPRFEFFGHGIVELARLTTGKSTREIEEIAELLVHSGYAPSTVDEFLRPLITARTSDSSNRTNRFPATLDEHGELVNEGMVATVAFLEQLASEIDLKPSRVVEDDSLLWAAMPLDRERPSRGWFGLRIMGTARLKGLTPMELIEVVRWPDGPPEQERPRPGSTTLLALLRSLAVGGAQDGEPADVLTDAVVEVDPNLVVVTSTDPDSSATNWIFGMHRPDGDLLENAIRAPITTPELEDGEPLETWLFRNREELANLYEGLRRSATGETIPFAVLREWPGYAACYLAAPHRSPD
jgi:hypothetical protein